MNGRLVLALAGALAAVSCATPPAELSEAPPTATACPEGLPAGTTCMAGRDSAGALYLIARPQDWNGVLVMHAHGGPTLGPPEARRVAEDLQRWSIVVRAGYAWAGSSFRQGGVAVQDAAEDTERLRRITVRTLGTPRRTILHGQSWGAGVAAVAAERYPRAQDGVLLTSGVLGGGSRSYDFRLDLRVVYQALCHNHPRPDEPNYPLWQGLPPGSTMTSADLQTRTRECLGLGLPAAQRSTAQAKRLKTLVDVIDIPERSVQGHLNWATFHFRDIAQRSGERPVFGNTGVFYRGSDDDAALNAAVSRYRADPAALAAFAADTDPGGRIRVPVLTVHAIGDPTAFVELEHQFRETMRAAGTAGHLVQTFTSDQEHSYLADPVYPALLASLLDWVEHGRAPTPATVAQRCAAIQDRFGPGCRFVPDYEVRPLATRVPDRPRP